ncbi:hypothetical protein PInf_002504 [Phytophthora infestans]|nr:hypothetical protein PInf_002504 [Phytophthora infestans]
MVRRNVELHRIITQHIGTEDMVADIIAKPLAVVTFSRFRKLLKSARVQCQTSLPQAQDTGNTSTTDPTYNPTRVYAVYCIPALTCELRAEDTKDCMKDDTGGGEHLQLRCR